MERWKQLNVFVSLGGMLFFIISMFFVKNNPLILCLSAFGLGVAWKGFKNIYKNIKPPKQEKINSTYGSKNKKKKKKKRKK